MKVLLVLKCSVIQPLQNHKILPKELTFWGRTDSAEAEYHDRFQPQACFTLSDTTSRFGGQEAQPNSSPHVPPVPGGGSGGPSRRWPARDQHPHGHYASGGPFLLPDPRAGGARGQKMPDSDWLPRWRALGPALLEGSLPAEALRHRTSQGRADRASPGVGLPQEGTRSRI